MLALKTLCSYMQLLIYLEVNNSFDDWYKLQYGYMDWYWYRQNFQLCTWYQKYRKKWYWSTYKNNKQCKCKYLFKGLIFTESEIETFCNFSQGIQVTCITHIFKFCAKKIRIPAVHMYVATTKSVKLRPKKIIYMWPNLWKGVTLKRHITLFISKLLNWNF